MNDQIDSEGEEKKNNITCCSFGQGVACGQNGLCIQTLLNTTNLHWPDGGVMYVTIHQRKLAGLARCVVKHDGTRQCTNSGGPVPRIPASLGPAVP